MKLFQYWDSAEPPAEVAAWIEGFRARNLDLEHRLFDRDAASWFIGKHVGPRERRAFDAIAVPAMQSDYFRYCAVWARGGVYVDADFQSREPLSGLLDQARAGLMLMWDRHVVGSLLMRRAPGDSFIRACLDLSTSNIEARRCGSAYTAAGPGVMNAIRMLVHPASRPTIEKAFDHAFAERWRVAELLAAAEREVIVTPALAAAFHAFDVLHVTETERWLGTEQPAYKQTGRHWVKWRASLYTDEPDS